MVAVGVGVGVVVAVGIVVVVGVAVVVVVGIVVAVVVAVGVGIAVGIAVGVVSIMSEPKDMEMYRRMLELECALGMAIGALSAIKLDTVNFNIEGLALVLAKLKKVAGDE